MVKTNPKQLHFCLILGLLALVFPTQSHGQPGVLHSGLDTIRIGIIEEAPFVTLGESLEETSGLSIQMWDQINQATLFRTQFILYQNFDELREGFRENEFDMTINPIPISPDWMAFVDYSQPYFVAQTTLMTVDENDWIRVFKKIFTFEYFSAIGGLSIIMLFMGLFMWLIERRENHGHFHKKVKGVFDGFWWSAVTLTTVGYGDKVPKSTPGRVLGFFWMFISIVMVSSLTAGITAILTTDGMDTPIRTINDLVGKSVGVLNQSPNEFYLRSAGLQPITYETAQEGLELLEDGKVEYVIGDRLVLNRIKSQYTGFSNLALLERPLKIEYYSFIFHKDSHLKEVIDPQIIRIVRSPSWQMVMDPD
jgi:ABC-type amino acid transport substrate-binding protein